MPPTEGRDALRECVAQFVYEWPLEYAVGWDELSESERLPSLMEADDLLAEIEGAGYRIVAADAVVMVPVTDEVLMPGFDPDAYDLEAEQ